MAREVCYEPPDLGREAWFGLKTLGCKEDLSRGSRGPHVCSAGGVRDKM